MTFTSFEFIMFFPIVVLLYNIIPRGGKAFYLLAASYGFYALLQPVYLTLLIAVTIVTYVFGRLISATGDDGKKHKVMICGIMFVIIPLFFFKYYNFVNNELSMLLGMVGIHVNIPISKFLLPIGISYYTFMSIGYLIDLYNEEIEEEKNIISLAVFLSFFPIVLSGPIERAGNMLPQIKDMKNSTLSDISKGFKIMLWGYFMKICVADRLGIYVDSILNNIPQHNGTTIAFASLLYPIQEYGDLGGYSLIAIGTARCLGYKVIPNFRRPFFAISMSDFWRRWHISLIQWLTDYIFTPMTFALRDLKMKGVVASLMVTFLVSGIWHGAAMTFIFWGLMQGVFLSYEAIVQKTRSKVEKQYNLTKKPLYILFCCISIYLLFAFSEIYGRSLTIGEANNAVMSIFSDSGKIFIESDGLEALAYGTIMTLLLFAKDFRDEFFPDRFLCFESKYTIVRIISVAFILFLVISSGVLDSSQFIYFQF